MGVPYDIELQLRPRTGGTRWVRCIGRAYTRDHRVVRVAGTIQDIDDRKHSELEVARLAERMTLAAKFAGIFLCVLEKVVIEFDYFVFSVIVYFLFY